MNKHGPPLTKFLHNSAAG